MFKKAQVGKLGVPWKVIVCNLKKEENYRKLSWTSLHMSAYVLGQEASVRKVECVMSSELWERRRQIKIPEPLVFSQFKKMDSGNVSRVCAAEIGLWGETESALSEHIWAKTSASYNRRHCLRKVQTQKNSQIHSQRHTHTRNLSLTHTCARIHLSIRTQHMYHREKHNTYLKA